MGAADLEQKSKPSKQKIEKSDEKHRNRGKILFIMSLSVVSSKFALLPDDDEDLNKKQLKTKVLGSSKASTGNGNSNGANEEKPKKKKNKKKKQNSVSDDSKDLQALAFGQKRRSVSTSSTGAQNGQNETNDEQLAHWMSQDQMVTDEAFAQDLQAAILASKVQYDVDCQHKDDLEAKKIAKKGGAKMTLQEFNRLSIEKETKPSVIESDTFFEDVEEATKMALNREQIKESLQQRYQALPDQSLILQYKSILEEKDTQIANLLSNNEQLTGELDKIKKRYKQFRELLEQVECRQKAEIVSENMKLKKVQGEIFQEVHILRQENEQLKTKLATMEKEKRK